MAESFQPGSVIRGTYRIEQLLGAGAMGSVFRAVHVRTQGACALKVLNAEGGLTPEIVLRFRREAQLLATVRHPSIVAVHDFDQTDAGTPFIVMDLVAGESLAERLTRGPIPWNVARALFADVAGALVTAHAAGVIHRDVKPANILLSRASDGHEHAVLVDFGLAGMLQDLGHTHLTANGSMLGTPQYLAPEQARGEHADVRADEYALALVLFEMLAGTPPFHANTVAEMISLVLEAPAPSLSSVAPGVAPPALDSVLLRALAKNPSQRFADVSSFAEAVRSCDAVIPATVPLAFAPTLAATMTLPSNAPAASPSFATFGTVPAASTRGISTAAIVGFVALAGILVLAGLFGGEVLDRHRSRHRRVDPPVTMAPAIPTAYSALDAQTAIAPPPLTQSDREPPTIVNGTHVDRTHPHAPTAPRSPIAGAPTMTPRIEIPRPDPFYSTDARSDHARALLEAGSYRECIAYVSRIPPPLTLTLETDGITCAANVADYPAFEAFCSEAAANRPNNPILVVCANLRPSVRMRYRQSRTLGRESE